MKHVFKFFLFCFLTATLSQGVFASPLPPPPGNRDALIQSFKDYMQYDRQSSYIKNRLDVIAESFFSKSHTYTTYDVTLNTSGPVARVFVTNNFSEKFLIAVPETIPGGHLRLSGNIPGITSYKKAYEVLAVENTQAAFSVVNTERDQVSLLYKGPLVIMWGQGRFDIEELEEKLRQTRAKAMMSGDDLPYSRIFKGKAEPIACYNKHELATSSLIGFVSTYKDFPSIKADESNLYKPSVMSYLLQFIAIVRDEISANGAGKLSDKTKKFISYSLQKEFLEGFCEYYSKNLYYDLDLTKEVEASYNVIKILLTDDLDSYNVINELRARTDEWFESTKNFDYLSGPKDDVAPALKTIRPINPLIHKRSYSIYETLTDELNKADKSDVYQIAFIHYGRGYTLYYDQSIDDHLGLAKEDLLAAYNILEPIHNSDDAQASFDNLLAKDAYYLGTVEAALGEYQKANEHQREAKKLGFKGPKWEQESLKKIPKILAQAGTSALKPEDITNLLYLGGLDALLKSPYIHTTGLMALLHDLMVYLNTSAVNVEALYKFQDIVADTPIEFKSFESASLDDWNKDEANSVLEKLDDLDNVKDLLKLLFADGQYYRKVFKALLQDCESNDISPQEKSDKLNRLIAFSVVLTKFAAKKPNLIPINDNGNKNLIKNVIPYEIARFAGRVYNYASDFEGTDAGRAVEFRLNEKRNAAKVDYRDIKDAVSGRGR